MSTPLHRAAALGVALIIGSAGLAACGDDNDSGGSGGGGGGKTEVTAACSLDNPPTSAASPPPEGGGGGQASGKVGVILPDTTSSTRYELYDKPLLEKALNDAGITADVQNAQGDKNKFASIAQSMIGDGAKVLIIDSIDAASGAGVEQQAAAAGVQVIDYDRVNLGGTAPYYVSFDNEDVGRLQAQTLVDCLNAQGVDKPKIIMMNGGTDVDNNAVLFQKGAHSVFDPLVESGDLEIAQEATVKGWKVENAAPAFTQALTASGSDVQGVLAANDDIANAVIGVLKKQGARRQGRRHRSGLRRRGSAEHHHRQAEHDGLQERHARGQRGRCAGHLAHLRAPTRPTPGITLSAVRGPAGARPQAPGAAAALAGHHAGQRPRTSSTPARSPPTRSAPASRTTAPSSASTDQLTVAACLGARLGHVAGRYPRRGHRRSRPEPTPIPTGDLAWPTRSCRSRSSTRASAPSTCSRRGPQHLPRRSDRAGRRQRRRQVDHRQVHRRNQHHRQR